jgi:hypothetical protein
MESLPPELLAEVVGCLPFRDMVRCGGASSGMRCAVDEALSRVTHIDTSIGAGAVDCVCVKCTSARRPSVHGRIDSKTMRKLWCRWPRELVLDWFWATPGSISKFMQSLSAESLGLVRHLTLKISDWSAFMRTRVRWRYMDLCSLTLECEGTSAEMVLTLLKAREWDVGNLFIRGDIWYISECVLYLPLVSDTLSLISTSILTAEKHNDEDSVKSSVRFIANMNPRTVRLHNIFDVCCPSCSMGEAFAGGVRQAMVMPLRGWSRQTSWFLDVATLEMIDALVCAKVHVTCGVFRQDVPDLYREYDPNRVHVRYIV